MFIKRILSTAVLTAAVLTAAEALPPAAPGNPRSGPAERRERRRLEYSARLDSTVLSRSYVFMPNSMEDITGGGQQLIYNQDYYAAVMGERVELHLPLVLGRGLAEYMKIINFDTYDVRGYDVQRTGFGWSITFEAAEQGVSDPSAYTVNILVNTYTGETALNLTSGRNAMHYIGIIEEIKD